MGKSIANILSYLFHPLLIPTWFLAMLFHTTPILFVGLNILLVFLNVVFQTFLMPFIAIAMAKKLNLLDSFEMHDKRQRIIPLIITMIFYIWFYMASKSLVYPKLFTIFMLGAVIALSISFVINIFFKLSLHMVAISGVLTMTMLLVLIKPGILNYYFILLIILAGAIASARLYLGAHTIKEVYFGFLVGMFSQLISLLFFH